MGIVLESIAIECFVFFSLVNIYRRAPDDIYRDVALNTYLPIYFGEIGYSVSVLRFLKLVA